MAEGPVLAAEYCDCESTKTVDIKRRVVEMKKQRSRNSQKSVWYVNIRVDRSKRVGDCRSPNGALLQINNETRELVAVGRAQLLH